MWERKTKIWFGDNAEVLEQLASNGMKIDLAYLDPPFYTNRVFEMDGEVAYDDRWPSRTAWVNALGRRISIIHRMMQPHASIVIHVTPRISHLVKGFCDRLFGENAFMSEVVWRYRRWPSPTTNFQRVHDVLIRYQKDPEDKSRWKQHYEPLAASTLQTWGTKKQRAVIEDGVRKRSSSTKEESQGVPLGDVWDIGIIAPVSKERMGYPTQKPEALLERVIDIHTLPGDVVLDPYMGSGTTIAVARRMKRIGVGIDQSMVAFNVATKRIFERRRKTA